MSAGGGSLWVAVLRFNVWGFVVRSWVSRGSLGAGFGALANVALLLRYAMDWGWGSTASFVLLNLYVGTASTGRRSARLASQDAQAGQPGPSGQDKWRVQGRSALQSLQSLATSFCSGVWVTQWPSTCDSCYFLISLLVSTAALLCRRGARAAGS